MSVCCKNTTAPRLLRVDDQIGASSNGLANKSAEPLDETLCSVPPLASREFKALFTDLRDRQEQLFAQVLKQQNIFQNHLVAIESGVRATTSAQIVSNRRQEEFFAEIRDFSSKSQSAKVVGNDFEKLMQPGKEAPDNKSSDSAGKPTLPTASTPVMASKCSLGNQDSALRRSLGNKNTGGNKRKSRRARGKRLLQSKEFEITIAVAILINSLVMCWECQYQGLEVGFNLKYPGRPDQAHVVWAGAERVFKCFDWFFGCLFVLEMLVKLVCYRHNYFYEPPVSASGFFHVEESLKKHRCGLRCSQFVHSIQGWNLLDSISVGAFLFDKVGAAGVFKPQMLRLLRLFRLGRLVRLLRFLESLDHLYVMTTAIAGLKKILLWAIVLLTLMLLTCDLFLVQILQATYFNEVKASNLTEDELERHHQMYEYFGTTTRCMLSMFEITLGNWPPIARLLSQEVSEWFILICLAHKLTIGFAVVGVITGCILQETFKVAQTDDIIMFRQKKMAADVMRRKMRALYEALDVSGDGKLQMFEIEAISVLPEIKTWLSSLNIETDDLHMLFDLIDVDMDGYITLEELCKRMPRIQGNARSIDVLAMQKQLWQKRQREAANKEVSPELQSCFADFVEDLPKV